MLRDKLEIILITYNRKHFLNRTLEQLFSEDSPVKDFKITVLDNHSDDGSSEIIDEYCAKFPNAKHIIHNRNIGGNANIARAFEISSSEYVWVICDDDYYQWQNWHYVEKAIEENHDAIVVANYNIENSSNIYEILYQSTFLPSGIYKTSTINTDVVRNMYDNIQNLFPHLAVSINIANHSKDFYVLPEPVVINGFALDGEKKNEQADVSYIRGNNKSEVFPVTANMWWYIAYVNTLTLMHDKNAVTKGLKAAAKYKPSRQSMTSILAKVAKIALKNKKSSNLFWDVFCRLNFPYKCLLMFYKIMPVYFFINPKGIFIQIFNHATIRIIPFRV